MVGPQGYAQVLRLMALAEAHAGNRLDCKTEVTDQPYAEVAWRRGGLTRKLDVNFGCVSPEANRVYDGLDAAQMLVGTWAQSAPVVGETPPAAGHAR